VISPAFESDLIAASCLGSTLSLRVNGETLLTISDSIFTEGQTGLALMTQAGPAEVHFDAFSIFRP
jgi:hypothetical protein